MNPSVELDWFILDPLACPGGSFWGISGNHLNSPAPRQALHFIAFQNLITFTQKPSEKRPRESAASRPPNTLGGPFCFVAGPFLLSGAIWGHLGPTAPHLGVIMAHLVYPTCTFWGFKLTSLSTSPVFLLEFILYHLGIHMEVMGLVLGHILKQNFTSCLASGWPTQAKIM